MTAIRKHLGDFIALTLLAVIALGVGAYIMSQQESRPRVPFLEDKPYKIDAAFSDAQAVIPGQGQSVRVAGVKVGLIGKVRLHEGQALVTLDIEKKYVKDLDLRSDATALLRPRTGLKDMFIELEPGSRGKKLNEGDTIPVTNTAPDVDPDEFLSALDSDTRSYLRLLIDGGGKGLNGNGEDLRQIFRRLGPTERSLKQVTGAIAERRTQMRRLVHNYGSLLDTLSTKDKQLVKLVDESNAVFAAFAAEEQNIAESVKRLPPTLRTTADTLGKLQTFSPVLRSSLQSLRPAFRQIDVANREVLPFVREAEPITRNQIRPFVRVARPYVRDLRPAAENLATATPDLTASFHELNRFFNMGAVNPGGQEPVTGNETQDRNRDEGYLFWLGWVSQNTVSLFSTSDATGPFRRALAGFSCTGIRETLASQPAAGALIGVSNALVTPGLCGGDATDESGGGGGTPGVEVPKETHGVKKAVKR
ncbi:MAG: phospholipid/cholesterol/gamma-HCH transport system substrate-binding protein [Solirubrobacteraceae bacterium]|nr:phospholipid/cholesterol/gamma-HCH transport system substrate-binding protein [Solirubrobacteraceae bacterium]